MPENIHDRVKRDRAAALPDATKVIDYRAYAEGAQRGTLSIDQKKILGAVVAHDFADNVCDLVLSTKASRLELTGFRVADDGVQAFLDDLFVKNQFADFSFDIHYRTCRDGNHAVGLRWQPDEVPAGVSGDSANRVSGRVTLHHEPWWDGKDAGVFVAYDDGGQPTYAVKDFAQVMGDPPRPRKRRTIYFPDHIERFLMDGAGWQPFRLASDPSGGVDGVVEWTKADGSPLGIPIVHFSNGRFGHSPYGVSDLAGGILGLQDELNDIQRDITAAARLTAFQMLWATGVEISPTKPLTVGPGRVLNGTNPAARFGAFPAGDMSQLIAAHEKKLSTIARNTHIPLHAISGGDWPSGAALIRAEMGLVSEAQRLAKTIGPAESTMAHRATEIANAFGRMGLNEDELVTAVFAPPEKLDELSLAEIDKAKVAIAMQLGLISDTVLLRRTGLLTDEEITALQAEREQRSQAAAVAAF